MKTSTLGDPQTGDAGDLVKLEATARMRPPHHSLQPEGGRSTQREEGPQETSLRLPWPLLQLLKVLLAAGLQQEDGQAADHAATSAAAHIWAPPAVAAI